MIEEEQVSTGKTWRRRSHPHRGATPAGFPLLGFLPFASLASSSSVPSRLIPRGMVATLLTATPSMSLEVVALPAAIPFET